MTNKVLWPFLPPDRIFQDVSSSAAARFPPLSCSNDCRRRAESLKPCRLRVSVRRPPCNGQETVKACSLSYKGILTAVSSPENFIRLYPRTRYM